jgi:hypothetical protein
MSGLEYWGLNSEPWACARLEYSNMQNV